MTSPAPNLTAYSIQHIRFDETIVTGKRLGWHAAFDSRSAGFPAVRAGAERVAIADVEHARHAPILDQARMGSCVGNADTGAAATSPLFEALPGSHPALDEPTAVALYELATTLDSYPGQMPPTDTGTDSTSGMKAMRQSGLISGWLNAFTVDDILQALMSGPVCMGFGWYDSFDSPNSAGLISIGSTAGIRGGHETLWRRIDVGRKLIGGDNSWSATWGPIGGSMWLSWADLDRLLGEGGDCVVPQPVSAPIPVPVPVPPTPTPDLDPVLAAYLDDMRLVNWAGRTHVGDNLYAAKQFAKLRAHFVGV